MTTDSGMNLTVTAEYEFYQYRAPGTHATPERNASATAAFLKENPVETLPPLTEGMFGYSLTRPIHNQDYYYGVFDACERFNCEIEGWHTESGPGVYEAVSLPLTERRWSHYLYHSGTAIRGSQGYGR